MASRNGRTGALLLFMVNSITGLRVVLIPFFIYFETYHKHVAALVIVIVIITTDIADGFFARLLDSVSKAGGIFDSLADFIVVISLFSFFFFTGALPLSIPVMVLLSFAAYSVNCLLNKSIIYTKFGSASGFLCMSAIAVFCGARAFFPDYEGYTMLAVSCACIAYLAIASAENFIMIFKRII
ncbi:MAG: CDP-alcohol phosphatidyltransferase family protein [Brevinematales bacterium]|jgi:phosphatidylglycerophosphate synthase